MVKKAEDIFNNRLSRWLHTIVINIAIIIVFGGAGYLGDKYFGTHPWLFIILLAISFPVSLAIQIYQIKKIK